MAKKQLKKKIQHSDTFYITRQNTPGIVQSWNDSRTQVNRNRRETKEAISKASIMVPSSTPEIAIPYNGTPVKDKATHVSYIGGDRDEARKAYWEEAPIIKAATDSIAGRYGINPELLRNRLNKEGFTDHAIANYNAINIYVPQESRDAMRHKVLSYNFINRDATIDDATSSFGLDDAATYINSGLASLINERWQDTEFKNEKGRETHPASGITGKDNMGIMAAVIKGFRNQAAKDFPNATPEELDNYANIYYNRGITGGRNYINNGNGSTPYTMAEGGPLQTHKTWDDLSMTEKAEMMKVAVRNGITNLNEIKAHYNEFAEGGNLYGGGSYLDKAKAMIRANEGWRSTPYKDAPKGKNWRSVGYGFNDSGFWEKYPEGISKHYEKGMTKAQAEQELTYYLGKAERQLRGIYGKRWDAFNDDQKAAILDTYYQRPASVGSKSGFYSAVMAGRDGTPYLGVRGFGDRNQSRRDLYRGRGVSAPMTFDTVSEPVSAEPEMISFKPLNPQAFDNPMFTYIPPTLMEEPVQVNPLAEAYSPEELERQEKRDNLERFNMFMNMLSGSSSEDNTGLTGMLGAMSMLSGNKKAYGGNIFDGDTEPTQQMQQGYIRQRPEGTYFYDVEGQPEIDVTPLNTSLSSNPADWTFTDAAGKIYNPHRDAVQGTGELRKGSQEGPILSAVNNYLRELNWRAKNDPASIALQGKYTMPTIAATGLLPWLGEAAAATNVAGVPLMTWADAGLTAGFGAHGLNHWLNEGINGWGDAAMTALEIAPMLQLAKPIYKGAATAVENYRYSLGRPTIPEGFSEVAPNIRTKLGDVEINNPNLYYRQGSKEIVDDYLSTGTVRGVDSRSIWGDDYANNPMFQKGSLFYNNQKPGLLVSNGKMNYADVLSRPITEEAALRGGEELNWGIPAESLNPSNTVAYRLEPNYGYKRVNPEIPTISWQKANTPQITAENAANEMPNIVRTVQDNGKIRLSLPSHTDNKPRQFVLEPAPTGDNKYYVHMRMWDDIENKVPASNVTNEEKQQLFDALYDELPEGAEILFPKSGPGYYGTRGTVAGLQRLARDPRFTPGTKGTLQYLDKDGKTVRIYEGTSFIKIPQITAENAASITPEQWTAAQDAAIAKALNITPEEAASLTKEQFDAAVAKGVNKR